MITEEQIRDRVSELKTLNESRLSKYYRNYNYYNNTVANALKLGNWDYLLSAATSGSNKWVAVDSWSWNTSKGYIKFSNGLDSLKKAFLTLRKN